MRESLAIAVNRIRIWHARHWRALAITVGTLLLIDWVVVDRLQVVGRVIDRDTRAGIADAWISVTYFGEKPLVNLPVPPHPNSRTTACIGSRIAQTNRWGWFYFDEIAANRPLANKSFRIHAFKGDWIAASAGGDLQSSVFLWPHFKTIVLQHDSGAQIDGPASLVTLELPRHEYARSEEVFSTLRVVTSNPCGRAGLELSEVAMVHALEIAITYGDRDWSRASCLSAKKHAGDLKTARVELLRRIEPDYVWPFDCDNLPFKKQPSPEVLAVEARDRADREARLRAQGEIP